MDIYLADENSFTSQMMVQELLEDQTQRFLQLIESQALGMSLGWMAPNAPTKSR
jgi:hypothetical protein